MACAPAGAGPKKRLPRTSLPDGLHPDTLAVREGLSATAWGEHSEALFLTSSFVQPEAATAAARFANQEEAFTSVDNCFCSPALQRPAAYGADFIVHSGTKYLDGQGRVLGGAICGDTKTTITHPASTSHGRLSEAQRLAAGITQGMIRLAVGLEDLHALKTDLLRGVETLATTP